MKTSAKRRRDKIQLDAVEQLLELDALRPRHLLILLRGLRGNLLVSVGSSIVLGFSEAMILLQLARLGIGAVGVDLDMNSLAWMNDVAPPLIGLITLVLIRLVVALLRLRAVSTIRGTLTRTFRTVFLKNYAIASWSQKSTVTDGEVNHLVVTASSKMAGHANALMAALGDLIVVVSLVSVAMVTNPLTSGVLVMAMFTLALLMVPLRRVAQRKSSQNVLNERRLATLCGELPRLRDDLSAFGVSEQASKVVLDGSNEEVRFAERTRVFIGSVPHFLSAFTYFTLAVIVSIIGESDPTNAAASAPVLLVLLRALTYSQGLQNASLTVANFLPILDDFRQTVSGLRCSSVRWGNETISQLESISLHGISATYPGTQDVSIRVDNIVLRSGDRVALLGTSGSGKSSFLKVVAGLLEPSSGKILVNGVPREVLREETWHRCVGFLPQFPNLVEGSLGENVRFLRDGIDGSQVRYAIRGAALTDAVVGTDELMGFETPRISQGLSGGQVQRVGFARSVAGNPSLLLLDEPTSALDRGARATVIQTALEDAAFSIVVVATHDFGTAALCNRALIFEEGAIIYDGPVPREFVENMASKEGQLEDQSADDLLGQQGHDRLRS